MADDDTQKTLPKVTEDLSSVIKLVSSVIGLMVIVFVFLNWILPTSLVQPIGVVLIGLIFTAVLIVKHRLTWVIAMSAWLFATILILIIYLIISRPVTVIGTLIQTDNTPAQGIRLILNDSSGVDHKSVTDADGKFEFRDVPQGRYTISIENGKFLHSGSVPSGMVRLLYVIETVGQFPIEEIPTAPSFPAATSSPKQIEPTVAPEMIVEQLGEKFSEPGDIAGVGGSSLIISITQSTKVVVRTNIVQNSTQHLWMFICFPEQNESNIQCNARELSVTDYGVFNDIVIFGGADEIGKCELLYVGFAIVDNASNDMLQGIPTPMLKSFTSRHVLIQDWYQVQLGKKNDGSDLNCGSEEDL